MRSWISIAPVFLLACSSGNVTLGGPPTLVRVDSEPPGVNCPSGGVVIRTGIDKNGDGFLDDAEVTSSQYVCNGVQPLQCDGGTIASQSVTVTSDADLAQLDGVDCVSGDLVITGVSTSDLPALPLSVVTGDVVIAGNPQLTSLSGLASLHSVGDMYLVQGNPQLADVSDLAHLDRVQNIRIVGNDGLVDLAGLSPISTLQADLHVEDNANLVSLHGLDNLITTTQSVYVRGNPKLTSLDGLGQLRTVAATIDIEGNASLQAISLTSLDTLGRQLVVNSNAELSTFTAPMLTTIGALSQFYSDDSLTTVSFPALVTAGQLYLQSDAKLTSVSAPRLSSTTGDIQMDNDPLLANLDLSNITLVGGALAVRTAPSVTTLATFSHVTLIGGALTLDHADGLVDFSGLDAVTAIDGDMIVTNNLRLQSFRGLGSLSEIGGALTISGNAALPLSAANAFANRVTVHGRVTIQ